MTHCHDDYVEALQAVTGYGERSFKWHGALDWSLHGTPYTVTATPEAPTDRTGWYPMGQHRAVTGHTLYVWQDIPYC